MVTNNSIYINDTFNANPDGIFSILEYMKIFKGKKILVLTPLIELGDVSEEVHKKLAKEMAKKCDLVLLTNSNYYPVILQSAKEENAVKKFKLMGTKDLGLIKSMLTSGSVICFVGKESKKFLDALTLFNN